MSAVAFTLGALVTAMVLAWGPGIHSMEPLWVRKLLVDLRPLTEVQEHLRIFSQILIPMAILLALGGGTLIALLALGGIHVVPAWVPTPVDLGEAEVLTLITTSKYPLTMQ